MKDNSTLNKKPFEVNTKNDQLLLDYIKGRLNTQETLEVKTLISTSKLWREYFLDLKHLYLTHGENGLINSSLIKCTEPELSINEGMFNAIKLIGEQQKHLINQYRKCDNVDKEQVKNILSGLISMSEILSAIPEDMLETMESFYERVANGIINSMKEIIDIEEEDGEIMQYLKEEIYPLLDVQKSEEKSYDKERCTLERLFFRVKSRLLDGNQLENDKNIDLPSFTSIK